MGLEYVNVAGDRYYLLQGKTKTGKPKYYASRKSDGVPVDRMPEGFEFYEHPERGLVTVRRILSSEITSAERQQLEIWIRDLAAAKYFKVDVQKDSLVVYTPGTDPAEKASSFERILGPFSRLGASTEDFLARTATYLPMMRFKLVDPEERLYTAARWCFRDSIDGWFSLAGPKPLESQARKYLPHLTKQSFFDLM